ncbi:hypothetical protein MAPG_09906 [Magnaporthiopsis poae ATCC 64411]|uniref:Peptidase A1 domain-containing protein n=1 Tax=Magnaporthiopsis poae (strain ATCC 64411 / 73-15) TaxID=644358 RepID=A0A0C4EB60_MAGP6|nr:hypothetical protein MAPG_09906 [Magnaporthiopsis poae ATCC 64411]
MPSFVKTLAVLASVTTVVTPSPVDSKQGKDFSIKQLAIPNSHLVNDGAAALARVYENVGDGKPPLVARQEQRGSKTANVTASPNLGEAQYLTPVKIGTPPVTFNVNLDTTPADSWVIDASFKSVWRHNEKVYNASKSSTSKLSSRAKWEWNYARGNEASGAVYTDLVEMGGLSYVKQVVQSATKLGKITRTDVSDGTMGLAFNLPQFGFAEKAHGGPGGFDFGTLPAGRYTGDIAYVPADNSLGYWNFTIDNVSVGKARMDKKPFAGVVDTGTTFLLLEFWLVKGRFLNYSPMSDDQTTCVGGIQPTPIRGYHVIGVAALRAVYVVLDASKTPRIGWATKKL